MRFPRFLWMPIVALFLAGCPDPAPQPKLQISDLDGLYIQQWWAYGWIRGTRDRGHVVSALTIPKLDSLMNTLHFGELGMRIDSGIAHMVYRRDTGWISQAEMYFPGSKIESRLRIDGDSLRFADEWTVLYHKAHLTDSANCPGGMDLRWSGQALVEYEGGDTSAGCDFGTALKLIRPDPPHTDTLITKRSESAIELEYRRMITRRSCLERYWWGDSIFTQRTDGRGCPRKVDSLSAKSRSVDADSILVADLEAYWEKL